MLDSSLSYILIRSFPECTLLLIGSYILLDIKLDFKDIFKNSIFYVIILTFIRILPISFGIHTVLSMFILGTILYKLKKQDIISTILTISEVFVCLAMSESIYMLIVNKIIGVPEELLADNTKIISAILTLPSLVILIFLIVMLKFTSKKLNKKYKEVK